MFKYLLSLLFFWRKEAPRLPLPEVCTIGDIQHVLSQIEVIDERRWSLPDPEEVWATKKSGCMGFVAVVKPLLISIGKEAFGLKILCYNPKLNHAITVWMQDGQYRFFSDQFLRESGTDDLDTLCLNLKREQFKKHEVI